MTSKADRIVVIGAGIGGLAAALRLAHSGADVCVIEAQATPGGKMRTLPTDVGPVDAGPTVLTMKPVFDALFADVGLRLEDYLSLSPLDVIARHFWDDGTRFDLMADQAQTLAHVRAVFGARAAEDYARFTARAARLFDAFDAPMMQAEQPSRIDLTKRVIRQPQLIADMAPHRSLAGVLRGAFKEPKLAQLFGRYATYVGGSPYASPGVLALISASEAQGVWTVKGGMHRLAQVLVERATALGAVFQFGTPVQRIITQGGKVAGVDTAQGAILADKVVFNGDPAALSRGMLGAGVTGAVVADQVTARSLSAYVHAFAAAPSGLGLAHHNVLFGSTPKAEFDALAKGQMPDDATLYICAQDHGQVATDTCQRFEIIMNAPPVPRDADKEKAQCQTLIFDRLARFGLRFSPMPGPATLTTPQGFETLFPASDGALYGRSPQGMMAAFKRPTARTKIPGLYLCGGGAHPGAGVPMATLSARHVAAAIRQDQTLTLMSPPVDTRGGMLTGSAIAGPKRSV